MGHYAELDATAVNKELEEYDLSRVHHVNGSGVAGISVPVAEAKQDFAAAHGKIEQDAPKPNNPTNELS